MRFAFIAAAAPLLLTGLAAQAMPSAVGAPTLVAPQVTLVGGGCGMGYHRGAFGRCRRSGHVGRHLYRGVGFGGPRRTTATGGNAGGFSDRN